MIKKHYIELLAYVALDKSKEYHTENISAFKSGSHFYFCNQALISAQFNDSELQGMRDYFGSLPYSVWVKSQDKEPCQNLLSNGFKLNSTNSLMSLDLNSIAPCVLKEGIEVKELTDLDAILNIWAPLVAESFEAQPEEFKKFILYLKQTPVFKNIRFFVGYLNGVPASTNMLVVHKDIVAMDWVGTIPAYRNKGLGFAVSNFPLHVIKKNTNNDVILFASESAKPIYQKIGFKVIDLYDIYVK